MFYTNGKIIIERFNNQDELKKGIEKLEKYLLSEKGIEAKFEPSEEHKYPAYIVPEGISYHELDEALRPHIALRAINEDEIILAGTRTVNTKYNFTEDEMKLIASDNMNLQSEFAKLESQKIAVVKEYASRLAELDSKIKDTMRKYLQAFEWRDYECNIKINFADRKKYYCDKQEEGTVRKVEDLSYDDFQLRMEHSFEISAPTQLVNDKKTKVKKTKKKKGEGDGEEQIQEGEENVTETTEVDSQVTDGEEQPGGGDEDKDPFAE